MKLKCSGEADETMVYTQSSTLEASCFINNSYFLMFLKRKQYLWYRITKAYSHQTQKHISHVYHICIVSISSHFLWNPFFHLKTRGTIYLFHCHFLADCTLINFCCNCRFVRCSCSNL